MAQPGSVLFACSHNAVRSPMALGLARSLFGKRIFFDSVGVHAGELDPFAVAVLDEIGIDISRHKPKSFGELEDDSFDRIISLSPEAHHKGLELTRTMACDAEYWPTIDPTVATGTREQILDAYRAVRDGLERRIRDAFGEGTLGHL